MRNVGIYILLRCILLSLVDLALSNIVLWIVSNEALKLCRKKRQHLIQTKIIHDFSTAICNEIWKTRLQIEKQRKPAFDFSKIRLRYNFISSNYQCWLSTSCTNHKHLIFLFYLKVIKVYQSLKLSSLKNNKKKLKKAISKIDLPKVTKKEKKRVFNWLDIILSNFTILLIDFLNVGQTSNERSE